MDSIVVILDEAYAARERVGRDELYRRAVAADASPDVLDALDALPEGEYAYDEVTEVLGVPALAAGGVYAGGVYAGGIAAGLSPEGIPATQLTEEDLIRELAELHRTRNDTFRHGSDQALERHTERQTELELEYLRRFPDREISPERLRSGARARA
ncbi:DUF6158 family protein [Hamadaea tsunoensis]|uniref:DUF6158 family protein n=1 Tax=Hamadaea tsunoensis TaxID=53368 RepID=UPI0004212563|nr:DUF2795 domain-containing protein [Hamadaea tsunoensis]